MKQRLYLDTSVISFLKAEIKIYCPSMLIGDENAETSANE